MSLSLQMSRAAECNSQHTYDSSQPSVSPVPVEWKSFDLHGYKYSIHTEKQAHAHIQITKLINTIYKCKVIKPVKMNIYLGENIGFCLFICMFLVLKEQIKYSTKIMEKQYIILRYILMKVNNIRSKDDITNS